MSTTALPEMILQFGAGRFLRAFADLFISQANAAGQAVGRIVIVQSTGAGRASALAQGGGRYHVLVRGYEAGAVVDRVEESNSVSRALAATSDWDEVRRVACSPQLKWILSNTTEAGYSLDATDRPTDAPPKSFPAKLLTLLRDRHEAGQPPLVLIPCELRERNADTLRELVLQLAAEWNFPEAVRRYVGDECTWLNTLVDRIVVNPPDGHPLTASDPMACVGEPYALWAIESRPGLPRLLEHPAVVHTPDVMPYFLRKVRILNGAHTALLIKAWPRGFRIVRDAVNDPELGAWLERLLFEEIVPTISERVAEAETFARQTLERFRNPFQEHKLADIAAHHAEKVKVRLVPTAAEHREKFGRPAVLLDEVLALPAPVIE